MTELFESAPTKDKFVKNASSNRADKIVKNLSKSKNLKNNKSKNLMHVQNIGAIGEHTFLTSGTKEAFNYLRQVFIKAPILQHFNP